MAFIQICKKSESTAQIIRSLSKDQINIGKSLYKVFIAFVGALNTIYDF